MAHGGARPNSGRKSKAEEQSLQEKLAPMDDIALSAIKEGLAQKDHQYVKLFMEYRYGKPKEKVSIDHSGSIEIEQIQGMIVK